MSLASASAPVGTAPLGSTSASFGLASAPGPSSGLPPRFAAPLGASAPTPSAFAFAPDDPFDPGFSDPVAPDLATPDPESLPPQSVPDSVRAEVRRMYQYLVDLFPQAAGSPQALPPPRALFEEFFSSASTPHQPVYLSWFERVRSALSEADSRLASLLASSRSESTLLPLHSAQYAVKGEHVLGYAVPVNPPLLAMFEHPLRPSLHLGLTVREAAVLEALSRSLLESLSRAMWLLSGLLGFVRLQGFFPSDAALFNTLVTSLSKCLAHHASLAASQTAFVGLKHRQFYLSHLPAYFLEVNKRTMLASPLVCVDAVR